MSVGAAPSLSRAEGDKQIQQLFDFMCDDLNAAKKGGSAYLVALGLSCYTEVLGGYRQGNLSKNHSKSNYNYFIENYFPDRPGGYKDTDNIIKGY